MLRKYLILVVFMIPFLLKAQIYLADNGLSITGTGVNKKVRLGGSLLLNTSFDLGATFTYNIKKGTANYLHILNNGNIGFGTNAPTASFDVVGASRFRNSLTIDYGTVNRTTQIRDNGLYISRTSDGTYQNSITGDGEMIFNTRGNYRFINNSISRFTIQETGNVGIGIDFPLAQLHSTGSVRFAGLLIDNAAPRVIASDINGNLSWRDVSTLGGGSTIITASNGLIKAGDNIQLGGALTQRTKIDGGKRFYITDTIASNLDILIYRRTTDSADVFRIGPGIDPQDTTSTFLGRRAGKSFGYSGAQNNNTIVGSNSGTNLTSGYGNTLMGSNSFSLATNNNYNTFIGNSSAQFATNAGSNTAVGAFSSYYMNTGTANTTLGYLAGGGVGSGNENVIIGALSNAFVYNQTNPQFGNVLIGAHAGYYGFSDSNVAIGRMSMRGGGEGNPEQSFNVANVAIGFQSLSANVIGLKRGNVAIGHLSARDFTGNNQLFIENSESPTPLIHGDFASDTLRFNGKVSIRDVDSSNSPQNMLYVTTEGRIMKAAISAGSSSNWNTSGNNIVNANTGFVSIGTSANPAPTDPQLKLAVNGNIYAQKLKITQQGWADYVFEPNYKLMPLSELEAFINKNKHLPDVPSATDVETKGLDLGDNQTILLKKIEELTLYVIELKKEIETIKVQHATKSKSFR